MEFLRDYTEELLIDSNIDIYSDEPVDEALENLPKRYLRNIKEYLFPSKEMAEQWLKADIMAFFAAFGISKDSKCRMIIYSIPKIDDKVEFSLVAYLNPTNNYLEKKEKIIESKKEALDRLKTEISGPLFKDEPILYYNNLMELIKDHEFKTEIELLFYKNSKWARYSDYGVNRFLTTLEKYLLDYQENLKNGIDYLSILAEKIDEFDKLTEDEHLRFCYRVNLYESIFDINLIDLPVHIALEILKLR